MSRQRIRNLAPQDLPSVVKMLHESFDRRLRPFMTYTQHGIGNFLSVPLQYPELPSNRTRLVVEHQEEILGFADFRMLDYHKGHLSYICVKPSARGQGVATALISEFLRMSPHVEILSLDVFRDNDPAKALYRKLGFETEQSSAWITRPLPDPRGSLAIASIEASMASYHRHGFCELDIRFEQQPLTIGLIGRDVVRCFSVDSFENDALLAAMRRAFNFTEQAMTIVPEVTLPDIRNAHRLATLSDRMTLGK